MKKIVLFSCITSALCAQSEPKFGLLLQNLAKQGVQSTWNIFKQDPLFAAATTGLFASGVFAWKGYNQVKKGQNLFNGNKTKIAELKEQIEQNEANYLEKKAQRRPLKNNIQTTYKKLYGSARIFIKDQIEIADKNLEQTAYADQMVRACIKYGSQICCGETLQEGIAVETNLIKITSLNKEIEDIVQTTNPLKENKTKLKKQLGSLPNCFSNPYIQASGLLGAASLTALACKLYYNNK